MLGDQKKKCMIVQDVCNELCWHHYIAFGDQKIGSYQEKPTERLDRYS